MLCPRPCGHPPARALQPARASPSRPWGDGGQPMRRPPAGAAAHPAAHQVRSSGTDTDFFARNPFTLEGDIAKTVSAMLHEENCHSARFLAAALVHISFLMSTSRPSAQSPARRSRPSIAGMTFYNSSPAWEAGASMKHLQYLLMIVFSVYP